ncbi:MAG: tetratricopeptide repeat protein, partial [Candidatus Marinimicrobia bacterium]|nr:tetratricopeptide repeat protein [Candidatus Neomarinimicrobiota bacterium]
MAWIIGCAGSSPKDDRDFESQFKKAKTLLEKKKYIRAQEEFHLLVLKASHTDIGDDALFYLGESYFLNKEYPLAISQYDRLIRKF